MVRISSFIIRWTFYALFFFVPLVFYSGSFELFEYNKMMLVYAATIIITALWLIKLLYEYHFSVFLWLRSVRQTPLDIPLALYLVSHVISTVVSIDPHTSIWGYYSRFHEGLLATLSYIVLYYAAVSNLHRRDIFRIISLSFTSGVIVSLYGALEHFGHSPSCLAITGKFDDDCWVQDVKSRVFATLGQPNWMAAYLDILILTLFGFIFNTNKSPNQPPKAPQRLSLTNLFKKNQKALATALFFVALLFTRSRSGFLGLVAGFAALVLTYLVSNFTSLRSRFALPRIFLTIPAAFLFLIFIFGSPFAQLEKYTLNGLINRPRPTQQTQKAPPPPKPQGALDAYESADIRKVVWAGAVKVWQRYPIFGSGVETFAYAYYKDRLVEHNLLSEWDFLYNKAHNEFLNILATTGTVGMLAYLSIIAAYSWWLLRSLRAKDLLTTHPFLTSALFAAFISILVTNFFGFSVVIIGLFFFLIPAFSFVLLSPEQSGAVQTLPQNSARSGSKIRTPAAIKTAVVVILLIALFGSYNLIKMWLADKAYAYGHNLDAVQQYSLAFSNLDDAVKGNPDEPTFRDELAYNESVLALALFNQASGSAQEKLTKNVAGTDISANYFVQRAIRDSDSVVTQSPNVLSFWKGRTKVFYNLSQMDRNFLYQALQAIEKSADLAPTDAKVHYNLGIILSQTGDVQNAIKILEETVRLKPDYIDAHYALALNYAEIGQKDKAREHMLAILKIGNDSRATDWLKANP